ncbi:MAG: DMT family transporter [Acetobacteraceae bacterium]
MIPGAPPSAREFRPDLLRGVIYITAAYLAFTFGNAIAKAFAPHYSLFELVFFRNAGALPLIFGVAAARGGFRVLRTRQKRLQVTSALAALGSTLGYYAALALLPLGDAAALGNALPIFLTILAIPMLHEHVGIHRWTAVLIGFVGLLVTALGSGAFGGGDNPVGVVLVLAQSLSGAISQLQMRQLARSDRSITIVTWQICLLTLFCALPLPFVWTTPPPFDFFLLVLLGVLGGLGQYLVAQAFHYAEASQVAPWSYSGTPWAMVVGFVLWSEMPTGLEIVGTVIVILAGLYILRRERVRRGGNPASTANTKLRKG